MSLETKKYRLISVPAEIDDDTLQAFFDEMNLAIRDYAPEIALDCSALEHATSRHINALWDALTRCESKGIPMRLTGVGYGLRRVLRVLDLAELFTVEYDGSSEARPAEFSAHSRTPESFEEEFCAGIEVVTDVTKNLKEIGPSRLFTDERDGTEATE